VLKQELARPSNKLFYVSNSLIHGKGLFALAFIKKGTCLGTLETQKPQEHELDGPYIIWSDDMSECAEVICDLKFINHSTEPNVAYYDDNTVCALNDINPHTELTHNYEAD